MARGLYLRVQDVHGRVGPAYAVTNADEYFAELTEAYFGRNDFEPFTRAQLSVFDRAGYSIVRSAWEAPTSP